jgi:hypothetical protein
MSRRLFSHDRPRRDGAASLRRTLRASTLFTFAGLACLTLRDARAAWPPAPGANMSDASNWPNDPGYPPQPSTGGGQWNLWSFLPPQLPGTPP